MKTPFSPALVLFLATLIAAGPGPKPAPKLYKSPLNMNPPPLSKDPSVKYDYDIIYVRAPRKDGTGRSHWAEVGDPRTMEPGADLMLLHPNGKEEILVAVKPQESVADPFVSFDGKSVYYAKFHDAKNHKGS